MHGLCKQGEPGEPGLEAQAEVRGGGRARTGLHGTDGGVLQEVPHDAQSVCVRVQTEPDALRLGTEGSRHTCGVREGVDSHHVPPGRPGL